jgi:hypothetical protein
VHHDHGATGSHGSNLKYLHVGHGRVRALAKNATRGQLLRHGPAIVAYDSAYVAFVAVRARTLAPLRGRLRALREWRRCRRAGRAGRGPVELEPALGVRAALSRRRVWIEHSSAPNAGNAASGPPER